MKQEENKVSDSVDYRSAIPQGQLNHIREK